MSDEGVGTRLIKRRCCRLRRRRRRLIRASFCVSSGVRGREECLTEELLDRRALKRVKKAGEREREGGNPSSLGHARRE